MAPFRVTIGGPANSGKSTFAVSLSIALSNMGVDSGLHEIDVYSDTHQCIRGDKPWSARQKRVHFPNGDLGDVEQVVERYRRDERTIVLGDLPGNIHNPHLALMVRHAHAAIILSKDVEGLNEWERFFEGRGIRVLIRVLSYLDSHLPMATLGDENLFFVGGLNRKLQSENEQVCNVARKIIATHPCRVLEPTF